MLSALHIKKNILLEHSNIIYFSEMKRNPVFWLKVCTFHFSWLLLLLILPMINMSTAELAKRSYNLNYSLTWSNVNAHKSCTIHDRYWLTFTLCVRCNMYTVLFDLYTVAHIKAKPLSLIVALCDWHNSTEGNWYYLKLKSYQRQGQCTEFSVI
jgi:hypothetical protein